MKRLRQPHPTPGQQRALAQTRSFSSQPLPAESPVCCQLRLRPCSRVINFSFQTASICSIRWSGSARSTTSSRLTRSRASGGSSLTPRRRTMPQ